MAQTVHMPQLGESVAEGVVARWLKHEGEDVAFDEPLVEIVTDKVNAEVPSEFQGRLVRILVAEGETVPVGAPLAELETADAAGTGAESRTDGREVPAGPAGDSPAVETAGAPSDGAAEATAGGPRRYSPVVRRLAQEHGIDLEEVRGTGMGGRVTRDDVLAHLAARRAAPAASVPAPAPAAVPAPTPAPAPAAVAAPTPARPPAAGGEEEVVPLTPMRRLIAEHMVRSLRTAPHAVTMHEVDMTRLVRWRETHRSEVRARSGAEPSYLAFVVQATCEALKEFPIMNSSWGGDAIIYKRHINIGVAVSLDQGLIVPVIHRADEKNVVGLARAIDDLVERARAGTLAAADVGGGTFTVNNVGVFGSVASVAVINQPQAAILSMQAITKRVVVMPDDALAVRSIMVLSLSFDHRIVDGMTAGRFVQSIQRRLEGVAPEALL